MTSGSVASSNVGITIGIAGGVRSVFALVGRFAVTMISSIGSSAAGGAAGRFAVTTMTSTLSSGNGAGAATFVPAARADVTGPSDKTVPSAKPINVFTSVSQKNHAPYAMCYARAVSWLHGWREETRRIAVKLS